MLYARTPTKESYALGTVFSHFNAQISGFSAGQILFAGVARLVTQPEVIDAFIARCRPATVDKTGGSARSPASLVESSENIDLAGTGAVLFKADLIDVILALDGISIFENIIECLADMRGTLPKTIIVHAGVLRSIRAKVGPVMIADIIDEICVIKFGAGVLECQAEVLGG